jgi:hypothetical protein
LSAPDLEILFFLFKEDIPYWSLLEFIGVYWSLLEFIGVCWSLLEFVGVYQRLLMHIKTY